MGGDLFRIWDIAGNLLLFVAFGFLKVFQRFNLFKNTRESKNKQKQRVQTHWDMNVHSK